MASQDLPTHLKQSLEDTKVEYRQLGNSGLRVSVPIFGCMSLGDKRVFPWNIEEEEVCVGFPLLTSSS